MRRRTLAAVLGALAVLVLVLVLVGVETARCRYERPADWIANSGDTRLVMTGCFGR